MGKSLIIAEKPSVANDIARALGGFKSAEGYAESASYVIASAVGHLLELAVPEGVEPKKGKWSFASLPVIPPHFDLQPLEKTHARLKLLAKLLKRKDIDDLINACDAGREGELIFRNIIRYTKAKQPIRRLWLQSMTPSAIREGFNRLRDDEEMLPLADAAISRSEADWLVGINGTRAMTAFNSKSGGFFKTTVGRVQTPTLAVVVEREHKIRIHKPRDYWELSATFTALAGNYPGRWFDEKFIRPEKDGDTDAKPERIWELQKAESIRAKCLDKPGIIEKEESKPSSQLSPLLFDLTSLQREANGRFGFSASTTLKLAQSLYERHKVLTYPRTDSRALPEDYISTVRSTLGTLAGIGYGQFANTILEQGWVRPNKRIFNDAKVSDHFAIIPTTEPPRNLSELEQKLYDFVTRRFLAVFYPAAEFLETTRITRVEGEPFKSAGKVLQTPGWLTVYGKEAQTDDTPTLTPVKTGDSVQTAAIDLKATQTKPPPRFTEATLLSAMEGAGKLVEDEELREAMSEKGLGTPATRAAIIEGLISEEYMVRNGRELQATAKAFSLMELLNGLNVAELTKPELTGGWEFELRQVQRKLKSRTEFMQGIQDLTRRIVAAAKLYEHDTIPGDFGVLQVPCPKCGSDIHERYREFKCVSEKCDFSIRKTLSGRIFDYSEAEQLIREKQIGPLQGFRSKLGRPFAAVIKLGPPEFKLEFDFGEDQRGEKAQEIDFSGQEPLGTCPKCKARVFEGSMNYVCEKGDFKTGKIILQRPIEQEQIKKLLTTGKTDLLDKFISKKGRPFKAYLVLNEKGVGFEFEPRAPRAGGKGARGVAAPKQKIDFTGLSPFAKCPKCGGSIFETESGYYCANSQNDTRPCRITLQKVRCDRPIEPEQAKKLFTEKRTDLLNNFKSRAGKPFSACLVIEKGKIGFEFSSGDLGDSGGSL